MLVVSVIRSWCQCQQCLQQKPVRAAQLYREKRKREEQYLLLLQLLMLLPPLPLPVPVVVRQKSKLVPNTGALRGGALQVQVCAWKLT